MYTKEKIEKDKDVLWKFFCIALDAKHDIEHLKTIVYILLGTTVMLNISLIISFIIII